MSDVRIAPQSWMTEPATVAVVAALHDGGAAARFVGGCVRDALLGRPIADIDIATPAPPDRVTALLKAKGYRVIPSGIAHGTVTAVVGRRSFEITTLRRDVETDGRHATVAFTDDWDTDAARRDLTINAMSLDPDGALHDPFGGQSDLEAGRIRFVGDPRQRIIEDVLRLLRYFRFLAHYGRTPPDPEALAACEALAPRLVNLSAERVRAELLKLLGAADPAPVLALMRDLGVLAHFLPEAAEIDRLARLVAVEALAGNAVAIDPLRRLAALLRADAPAISEMASRLRLSKAEREYLLMTATEAISPALGRIAHGRLIHRISAAAFRELALLGWAGAEDDSGWRGLIDMAEEWTPATLPITGADVLERGVPHGPAIGDLLRAVEEWWIDGGFEPNRADCLARLDAEISKER